MRILVNRYERNAKARQACLAHYGHTCFGCGFNFQQFYGSLAAGYIHVHHLRPLSQLKARYQVDPIQDLRPVCANCHAVLHLRTPPYSIEELQAAITTTTYLAN
jgi:5-methylcytosine-specific restriction protein A